LENPGVYFPYIIKTPTALLEFLLNGRILIFPFTLPDSTGYNLVFGAKFQNDLAPVYVIDSVTLSSFNFL
jgi:hypothetical protein